ncbi:MAG: hypothetical protein ABI797_05595 [Chloroflexota bacterium]
MESTSVTPDVVKRMPTWRALMWVGVIGSVLAWAWVWYLGRGPSVVMLLFALAAVALSFRATAGMRLALAGLIVCGVAMLLASVYWMTLLYTGAPTSVTVADVFITSVVPLFASMFLLAGSIAGFRHARPA